MLKKLLKIFGLLFLLLVVAAAGFLTYLKVGFPKVSPAQDLVIEATPKRIERGRYLAHHVAVCIDCHSTRDWSKFSGPILEGTWGKGGELFNQDFGFPGSYTSKNITPAGLGEWSDGEIFRAVTAGVSRDGSPLFPIMQYQAYGKLDKEDIFSIIAYIKTLAPIPFAPEPSVSDFPMNFILGTIPEDPTFSQRPDTSNLLAYGKYITTMAACIECHTQAVKGNKLPGMEFAGGFKFKMPGGITVYSRNITPHPQKGIGGWSREQFVGRFKAYADSGYVLPNVPKGELNTPMPWAMYAGMTEFDLGAIYAYLQSVTPVDYAPPAHELGSNP